jgi:flavorubredoxin
MNPVELLENIYWVGAVDWNVRNFHGFTYSTHRGTTYNAYLIIDDKVALVDTVYGPFAEEMLKKIEKNPSIQNRLCGSKPRGNRSLRGN